MNRRSQTHPRSRRSLLIVVLTLAGVTVGMLPAHAHASSSPAACQKGERALGVTGEQAHDLCKV